MKPLSISIASAAILASASFGALAQGQPPVQENAPNANKAAPAQGGGAQGGSAQPSAEKPGGREVQAPGADRAGGADKSDRPNRADSNDRPGPAADKADPKGATEKSADKSEPKGAGDKSADKLDSKDAGDKSGDGMSKDGKTADKPDSDRKSAEGKDDGDKPGKQAAKDIKPEQKTVIKQTIVKQNIRPQKIDVQVRVGVRVPRTVVLYALPPTLIEIYPSYRPYKFVMVDDDTILVIDPDSWEIVDVIEV